MQVTFYSCIMAMFTSTLMIVVIYFLKKTKYFTNAFGVGFMTTLYFVSLIRTFVPFEIPAIRTVLGDRLVLPKIMDLLENRSVFTVHLEHKALYVFGSLSFLVTALLLSVFLLRQLRFVMRILRHKNFANDKEQQMLSRISSEVFGRKTMMRLLKSDVVSVPMVVGVLKSTVVIPDRDYSDSELELILNHECTHLKNHDLLFKLLVMIYCCVYWFNPFVYLLRADMDFILEIKCDNAVCARLSEEKRLDYAKLVNDNSRMRAQFKGRSLVTSNFAYMNGTQRHVYRMNNLLNSTVKRSKIPTAIVSLIMVAICAFSYLFVWQPDYSGSRDTAAVSFADVEQSGTPVTKSSKPESDDFSFGKKRITVDKEKTKGFSEGSSVSATQPETQDITK